MTKRLIFLAIAVISLTIATAQERIIFLNEGNWNSDDGQVSLIEGSTITNKWFQQQNPKMKIGDTPNDIIQVSDRHGHNLSADPVRLRFLGPGEFVHREVDMESHGGNLTDDRLVPQGERVKCSGEEGDLRPPSECDPLMVLKVI